MSITDVPPEYAVLTFGCAECGGKGKHEDSESEGGEEAGPEVLKTGLLPVPGRVLEGYKKAVGGGDGSMNLDKFYARCWNILRLKNSTLWTKKYEPDTAKAVLAMVAYVDVCIQKVVKNTRLSLSTKAAFDKDSNKKNLVRDVSGNIKLNQDGFYFGLTTYLQQQASYLCWANANKEKAEKGKGAMLKSNLQTAVARAELSISRMTREKDLDGFYFFVHEELRQGVSTFEIYENEATNDMNPDQEWMSNLMEEEKKNTSSFAYENMNTEIKFSKEDAEKITMLKSRDYNITPMNMLMRRNLSPETMLQPKGSVKAGVMLWNVFVFYAEKNAPKPARDWKWWPLSRGKGASGGGTNTVTGEDAEITDPPAAAGHGTSDLTGDLKKELEAVKERESVLSQENEKLKLEITSLKKDLETEVQELKHCMESNAKWVHRYKIQADQYSTRENQMKEQLELKKKTIDDQERTIRQCTDFTDQPTLNNYRTVSDTRKRPSVLHTRPFQQKQRDAE